MSEVYFVVGVGGPVDDVFAALYDGCWWAGEIQMTDGHATGVTWSRNGLLMYPEEERIQASPEIAKILNDAWDQTLEHDEAPENVLMIGYDDEKGVAQVA